MTTVGDSFKAQLRDLGWEFRRGRGRTPAYIASRNGHHVYAATEDKLLRSLINKMRPKHSAE